MKSDIYVLIIIALIVYISYEKVEKFINTKKICNDIDKRCYSVSTLYEDPEKASEMLAILNKFCIDFMRHLRRKYIWNHNINTKAIERVEFLLSNYNPDGIFENVPSGNEGTSYVDDKGRVFAICLREKLSGRNDFHDVEDLKFVLIHEMAHMATKEIGHDKPFWINFKFLLKEAKEAGIYEPRDYEKNPMNYCSLPVNHNPYFDEILTDIYSE
jgi:hypothetical protein